MSSFVHIDNKKKHILMLRKGSTHDLGDTTLTAQKEYSINFTELKKIFVNSVKIYKLKVKDSKINAAPLWLGNASKDFSVDNKKKTGLYGYVYDFSVDYDSIDVDDILNIHNFLMKKHNIKWCLDLLRKCLLDY